MNASFRRALRKVDPNRTVAYFWPGAPVSLLRECSTLAIRTVREMINSPCAQARVLLDNAYSRRDMPATHSVTQAAVEHEAAELSEYDYIFASNPNVEEGLIGVGVSPAAVIPTAFGWTPERFANAESKPLGEGRVRAVFVGTLCVRKGVLDLLDAWQKAGVDGELVLAGALEPQIEATLRTHFADPSIRYLGFVNELGTLYRSSDVFIFPTYEEGGPQVTYEAAGCGLPIITTAMGAARLVEQGKTGVIVPAGDVPALTVAIRQIAHDVGARLRMAAAGELAAARFTFEQMGQYRGRLLGEIALGRVPAAESFDQ